jgi:hypothetical protein
MSKTITRVPLSTRLAVFFATNPGEELATTDIICKFGSEEASIESIRAALEAWVDAGWFARTKRSRKGFGRWTVYSAGPELRKLLPKVAA